MDGIEGDAAFKRGAHGGSVASGDRAESAAPRYSVVADGEIGAAAFEGNGETHVILFRQKMKNLNLPREEAVIRLSCPDRPQSVTVKRIDEDHGNPLKLWEEMGRPDSLNPAETEDLKSRSAVRAEEWPFTWKDGELTIRAELGVNDVYGFVIR